MHYASHAECTHVCTCRVRFPARCSAQHMLIAGRLMHAYGSTITTTTNTTTTSTTTTTTSTSATTTLTTATLTVLSFPL
ncbi:hypothetical protein M0804_006156 [Polistes exclamans]|nr:hypothetical protein M0804_006156 [Polistes exclamans]